ncbi:MAG: hypothetical protein HN351_03160, partial [Deltaproteobacteria bacterium]|nr:hypothetical protein [Deltaproteobacteria bacterium]
MKIKLNFCRAAFILLTTSLLLAGGCSKKESTSSSSSASSSSTSSSTSGSLPVTEITQSVEGGYNTGSFTVPSDGVSFMLSVFRDNNGSTAFYSLSDPDGTDILSSSSTPTLYGVASGITGAYGYANVLVPQSPSFSAKAGTWTFKAYNNDRVKLALRSGTLPTS